MAFYLIIALIIISALGMILSKQLLHSALFLLVILLTVAGIFILSGAEFLGVAQILVYVGGILILLLFGIIVTSHKKTFEYSIIAELPAIVVVVLIAYFLYCAIDSASLGVKKQMVDGNEISGNSGQIGMALMTEQLFALEFMALFLLLALIGAVIIGGRKIR